MLPGFLHRAVRAEAPWVSSVERPPRGQVQWSKGLSAIPQRGRLSSRHHSRTRWFDPHSRKSVLLTGCRANPDPRDAGRMSCPRLYPRCRSSRSPGCLQDTRRSTPVCIVQRGGRSSPPPKARCAGRNPLGRHFQPRRPNPQFPPLQSRLPEQDSRQRHPQILNPRRLTSLHHPRRSRPQRSRFLRNHHPPEPLHPAALLRTQGPWAEPPARRGNVRNPGVFGTASVWPRRDPWSVAPTRQQSEVDHFSRSMSTDARSPWGRTCLARQERRSG